MTLTKQGKIFLGIEILQCPQCRRPNEIEIFSDLPERDWLICKFCGYKAILNFSSILDRYGLPHGLNRNEKRQIARHIKKNIDKI